MHQYTGRTEGGGGDDSTVEYEVGELVDEEAVFAARRFTLGSVGNDHGCSKSDPTDRPPLGADREPSATMSAKAAGVELVEELGSLPARDRPPLGHVIVERHGSSIAADAG
jgi:hypothetical protein